MWSVDWFLFIFIHSDGQCGWRILWLLRYGFTGQRSVHCRTISEKRKKRKCTAVTFRIFHRALSVFTYGSVGAAWEEFLSRAICTLATVAFDPLTISGWVSWCPRPTPIEALTWMVVVPQTSLKRARSVNLLKPISTTDVLTSTFLIYGKQNDVSSLFSISFSRSGITFSTVDLINISIDSTWWLRSSAIFDMISLNI